MMVPVPVLAHGGTAGAAAESLFVLVPIVVFSLLSRSARKRREAEDAAAEAEAAAAGPEATAP